MEIDELTIAGARRGDMRACEKIYRKFHTQAFTVAARICNNRELARDVTQEAFISAFKRLHQYRGDAPFWAWLRRVIVNHAVSALRKLPRHDAVELEDYMLHDDGGGAWSKVSTVSQSLTRWHPAQSPRSGCGSTGRSLSWHAPQVGGTGL